MNECTYFPVVIEKSEAEIKEMIAIISNIAMPEDVKNFFIGCAKAILWLPLFVQAKHASIGRLRNIIFGKGYGNKKSGSKKRGKSNIF